MKGLDRSLADDGIGSCDKVAQLKAVNEAQQSEIKRLREQIKRLRTLAASTHSLRSSRPPVSLRSSSASGSSDLHIKPRFKRNNPDPPRDGMDASALQHQSNQREPEHHKKKSLRTYRQQGMMMMIICLLMTNQ